MDDNDEYINESGDDEYTYDDLSDDEYVYDVDTANSFAEAKVCISQGINGTPSDKYHYSARDSKNNSTDKNEGKDNSFTTSENSNSGGDARKHRKNDRNSNLQVIEGKVVITDYSRIVPMMYDLVSDVSTLLGQDSDASLILLMLNKWNKEKLLDAFLGDPDKLLETSGLDLFSDSLAQSLRQPFLTSPPSSSSSSRAVNTTFSCRICCDDVDAQHAFGLGCKHNFCKPCFSEYLRNQICDGPSCLRATCPEHKCKQAITQSVYNNLCSRETYDKYEVYLTRNFIETSKTMRYCPSAGCDKVAVGSGITTVHCDCGKPFCFRCGEEAHAPCSCAQLVYWRQKCADESETANWILANTKKCPGCSTRIEKNQGCNHINCKHCRYEFCWICMGNWTDHGSNTGGFYRCNRYDAAKTDTTATAAKQELDRYLHYYQRYHAHDQSLKYANADMCDRAERLMVERQEQQHSSWMEVQFFNQAVQQLIECRRVLKYTYVLGYSLQDGTAEKRLFEYHQEMLEKDTERLHGYIEAPRAAKDKDGATSSYEQDKSLVINLTRSTGQFLASLLSSITNGVVESNEALMLDASLSSSLGL